VDPTADGFYSDPLVYDVLHAEDTASDTDQFLDAARELGAISAKRRATVFEPACGTGRYLITAARRGCHVIGIDLAPPMIEYAAARFARDAARQPPRVRGTFRVADMTTLKGVLDDASVDLAFCPINSIRHLESDALMVAHLREVARVLRPSGVYAAGISISTYGLEGPSEDVWEGRRGRLHVRQVVEYLPPTGVGADRFEEVVSHLVITRGRGTSARVEHRDQRYRLRCFSRVQWESVVRRAGLEVLEVRDQHGRVCGRPELGYGVWYLRPRVKT
jgi:SAM-dependent methyltransferase